MFFRVYDKENNNYYKSLVYAFIDVGSFEKAVFFNPVIQSFQLVNYFDELQPDYSKPLYEHINFDNVNFSLADVTVLSKLNNYLSGHELYKRKITHIAGYPEVVKNVDFLIKLFENKRVPLSETNITIRTNEDISDWNYIRTQKDADDFLDLFAGFHDATIKSMTYEESFTSKN